MNTNEQMPGGTGGAGGGEEDGGEREGEAINIIRRTRILGKNLPRCSCEGYRSLLRMRTGKEKRHVVGVATYWHA